MASEKKKTGYSLADKCTDEEEKLRKELGTQLKSDMKRLFTDNILTDLVIKVGNREFHVHKIIFQEMAENVYQEMMALPGSSEEDGIIVFQSERDLENLKETLCSFYTDDDISSSLMELRKYFKMADGENVDHVTDKEIAQLHLEDSAVASGEAIAENGDHNSGIDKVHDLYSSENNNYPEKDIDKVNDKETNVSDNAEPYEVSSDEDIAENEIIPNTDNQTKGLDADLKVSRIPASDLSTGELVQRELGLVNIPKVCCILGEDLLRKLASGVACDCVVSVGDWEFPAHRCMLAARSSYFGMMLNGCWMESESERIILEGIDSSVVKQMLLYIYGGVQDLDPDCSIGGLVMIADMYDVIGMKSIVSLILNKDYCHFFHKPCPGCIAGVPETLPLTMMYNMPDMREKCLRWINKHKEKVWAAKSFALLPHECLDYCTQAAVRELNLQNVIDSLLECQRLNSTIPRLKWTTTVLYCVSTLMDSALEYASQNFVNIISGKEFRQLDGKSLGFNKSSLEEIFSLIITSLIPGVACESYLTLHTRLTQIQAYIKQQEENQKSKYDRFSEEYTELVAKLCKKCKEQLCLYIHQAVNTAEWFLLSKELQKEIMDEASYVCLDSPGRGKMAAKPKLTSMKKKPLSGEFRVSMKDYFDKHFGPKETFPVGAVEKTKSRLPQKADTTKAKDSSLLRKEGQKKTASPASSPKIGVRSLGMKSSRTVKESKTKSLEDRSDTAAVADSKIVHEKKLVTKTTSKPASQKLPVLSKSRDTQVRNVILAETKMKKQSPGDSPLKFDSAKQSSSTEKASSKKLDAKRTDTNQSLFANIRKDIETSANRNVTVESDTDSASQIEELEVSGASPHLETTSRRRTQSASLSTFTPQFGTPPTIQTSHSDDSFFGSERQGQTNVVKTTPTIDVKFVVPHEFYGRF